MRAPLLVVTVVLGLTASIGARPAGPEGPALREAADPKGPALHDTVPGAELPVLRERRYVMSGAVRPLLFWIHRDQVGLARIVWRGDEGGTRGYELLVGTEPARAPRGINRWGFISEETSGAGGAVLALMTGSHDTSYEKEASAAADGQGNGDFRAIRSRVADGAAAWRLARVRTPEPLTIHQLGDALDYLRRGAADGANRRRAVGTGVRSGFLVAVADLVDETLDAARDGGPLRPDPVRYVFGERTYELRVRAVEPVAAAYAGRTVRALHTSFETRSLADGDRTRFELTTLTGAGAAGVPLSIEWQPRWWLRVTLHLEEPPAAG